MAYYTTKTSIVKCDDDGVVIWQFNGEQVDEFLDDLKRMENLLTDLVQPESATDREQEKE